MIPDWITSISSLTYFSKDTNGFFAFPVTDSIAPGYSSIIINPMDFSTMADKIEAQEYKNVMEFKVCLLCDYYNIIPYCHLQ